MIGDFLRQHGVATLFVALGLILAVNIGMILQYKNELQNKKQKGLDISKSMEIMKNPWQDEDKQYQALSDAVNALQEKQKRDQEIG